MTEPPSQDAEKLAALRAGLPATGAGIYLDTATRGPLPAETAAAMREADEWELRVGRQTEGREEDVAQRAAEARAVLAAAIGADPAEIALMPGLELALGTAAWTVDWQAGDRALTIASAGAETFAVLASLRGLGVEVDVVDFGESVDRITAAMTPRTRLVILPHVVATTGQRLPIDAIAAGLRASDAWLVVDASNSVGVIALSAEELGVDFVAIAIDRWLLGPEGTTALWAGRRALADARPLVSGVGAFETLTTGVARPWPDARRFEPNALPRTTLLGLARSVGWLEMYVGLPWAFDRTERLTGQLLQALEATEGVEMLTPQAMAAGIVTFRLANWHAEEAAEELSRRVFAILRPLPEPDALRASVSWFNTEEELNRFAQAVSEVAGHTPATLPRLPSITMLADA